MAKKQANGGAEGARKRSTRASTNAPATEEVVKAQEAHAQIKKAQNTEYDHHYGHVDMRDEQIIGGGKERALINYNPGIIVTEKGREMDKKLDEHYECVLLPLFSVRQATDRCRFWC